MKNNKLSNSSNEKRNYILFTIAVFSSFAIIGVADILRGAVNTNIQIEFSLTEFQLGMLFAVNAAGYLLGCTVTGFISEKIGIKICHIFGMLLITLGGICIFFSPSFPILLISFFVLNFAFGALEIANGVIAAKIFTKNTGTMMNLAHFSFGAGAVFAPMVSTAIIAAQFGTEITAWRYVYLIATAFALLPIIPVILGRLHKERKSKKKTGYLAIVKKPTIWLVFIILSLGLVSETGVANWFANHLVSSFGFESDTARLFLTLYFVCFTLGRLVLGPFIDRIGFINSLAIATAVAGIFITIGLILGERGAVFIVLSGFGVAPIFPTVMAVIAKLFSDAIESVMTTILTLVGIFAIPSHFLIGGVINQARISFTATHGEAGVAMAFSSGFILFAASCFFACIFSLVLRNRQKKTGKLV